MPRLPETVTWVPTDSEPHCPSSPIACRTTFEL